MNTHLPSRQVCRSVSHLTSTIHPSPRINPSSLLPLQQCRNASAWDWFKRGKKASMPDPSASAAEVMKSFKPPPPEMPKQGTLADNSIFGPEESAGETAVTEGTPATTDATTNASPHDSRGVGAALDPRPWARARWQRKKVIQEIQNRGRLSKTEQILKQERHHMHGSDFFKTSIKKLMPIARQIAGKSIDDALVQLRFSKKLAARRVATELRIARDEAIVSKGMGLGNADRDIEEELASGGNSVPLKEKNGKIRMVEPTAMYIDQAWVNKTKYNISPEFRARGRVNYLRHPHTSISFLLKEEKTRLRLAREREEKKVKARPWLHHPDRSITAQRQYIMW